MTTDKEAIDKLTMQEAVAKAKDFADLSLRINCQNDSEHERELYWFGVNHGYKNGYLDHYQKASETHAARVEKTEKCLLQMQNAAMDLERQLTAANAEIARLRSALEFYAQGKHWTLMIGQGERICDKGDKARAALAGEGGE